MELLYIWVEKFRNYVETEINFSDKFIIKYNKKKGKIDININKGYMCIYPQYITNINAIVGTNSVGKTNLLDIIGLRKADRNKNNCEFEIKYKSNRNNKGFIKVSDIESSVKNSIYLFVYYFGRDNITGEELFCIEGNDLESFYDIFESHDQIKSKYWLEKYWFTFVCTYSKGKFLCKYDLGTKLGEYKIKSDVDGIKVYGDYRSEQDKLAVISVRENLNTKYYDRYSLKADDESYIMIPRRISSFNPKYINSKINMIYNQIINKNSQMYNDEKYMFNIEYSDVFLKKSYLEDNEFLKLKYSYKDLFGKEHDIYRLLESYIQFYFQSFNSNSNTDEENIKLKKCKNEIEEYTMKIDNKDFYKKYYNDLVEIITNFMINDENDKNHIMECYKNLTESLFNNNCYIFKNNKILIEINEDSQLESIYEIVNVTIDEKMNSDSIDIFSVFSNFFSYSISDLSDGESAYLGLFSAIYEQITMLTSYKEKYILTLDEPETHMHPELARNFVNDLIKFLGHIKKDEQRFQLIISTHSPFILSDIPNGNIVFLERDNKGKCKISGKEIGTFCQNIHMILKDGFFMKNTIGEFANQKIKDSLKIMDKYKQFNDSKIRKTEFKEEYIKYMGCKENEEISIEEMKKKIKYIIKIIGEPLIKRKLEEIYRTTFPEDREDYELEIKKLQQEKGKLQEIIKEKGLDNIEGIMKLLDEKIRELKEKSSN